MQNRCVAGCAIWVCVSALYGILTMTTLPNDAFFRMCPRRSVRKSFHNGVKCTAWKAGGNGRRRWLHFDSNIVYSENRFNNKNVKKKCHVLNLASVGCNGIVIYRQGTEPQDYTPSRDRMGSRKWPSCFQHILHQGQSEL